MDDSWNEDCKAIQGPVLGLFFPQEEVGVVWAKVTVGVRPRNAHDANHAMCEAKKEKKLFSC